MYKPMLIAEIKNNYQKIQNEAFKPKVPTYIEAIPYAEVFRLVIESDYVNNGLRENVNNMQIPSSLTV